MKQEMYYVQRILFSCSISRGFHDVNRNVLLILYNNYFILVIKYLIIYVQLFLTPIMTQDPGANVQYMFILFYS